MKENNAVVYKEYFGDDMYYTLIINPDQKNFIPFNRIRFASLHDYADYLSRKRVFFMEDYSEDEEIEEMQIPMVYKERSRDELFLVVAVNPNQDDFVPFDKDRFPSLQNYSNCLVKRGLTIIEAYIDDNEIENNYGKALLIH